jgi:hypothetical protein
MHRMLKTTRIATAPTAIPTTTPVEILDDDEGGDGGDLEEGGVGLRSELGGVLVEGGDGGLSSISCGREPITWDKISSSDITISSIRLSSICKNFNKGEGKEEK